MPCPGISTQESRGRLTTDTLRWSAATCTTISVSELLLATRPTCSWSCCLRVSPVRRSTPATRMVSGPVDGAPAVPALTRATWPLM
jgi:hypothetical protein